MFLINDCSAEGEINKERHTLSEQNLFLLITLFGIIYYIYYKYKVFLRDIQ